VKHECVKWVIRSVKRTVRCWWGTVLVASDTIVSYISSLLGLECYVLLKRRAEYGTRKSLLNTYIKYPLLESLAELQCVCCTLDWSAYFRFVEFMRSIAQLTSNRILPLVKTWDRLKVIYRELLLINRAYFLRANFLMDWCGFKLKRPW